jgi:hypothetical protein
MFIDSSISVQPLLMLFAVLKSRRCVKSCGIIMGTADSDGQCRYEVLIV